MKFVDEVSWSPRDNFTFAYKYPENNLSTYTQLTVQESQEACVFMDGRLIGKFGPGRYTLDTANLPLLHNLFGIPFGGNNPFTAWVYFVNKAQTPNLNWRAESMRVFDAEFKAQIPIVLQGRYCIFVDDAEKFLIKMVATHTKFSVAEVTDCLFGELTSAINAATAEYMQQYGLGFMGLQSQLRNLSTEVMPTLEKFMNGYGIKLVDLNITKIDVDKSTEEGIRISNAMTQRTEQNIAGYTWQQKQAFNTANNAVNHTSDLGMIGMAMMMGGGFGGGMGMGAAAMQPPLEHGLSGNANGNVTGAQPALPKQVFCAGCGKRYVLKGKFCPNCGKEYTPCIKCGSDVDPKSSRCVSCGSPIAKTQDSSDVFADASVCPRCGSEVSITTKFCQNCGNKIR